MEDSQPPFASDRISVWFVIDALSFDLQTIIDITNNIDPDQFDVHIWTILNRTPAASRLNDSVSIHSLNAAGKLDIRAIFRFLYHIKTKKPDILQSYTFFPNILCRLGAGIHKETSAISGVVSVKEQEPIQRVLMDKITLPLADHIISNSKAGKKFITQRGASLDSVSVIWNARDIDLYKSATAPPQLREELGIPQAVPVVGIVARLVETKGHHDLLDAWPAVRREHPTAHLLIVGDGPMRESLQNHAAHLEDSSSVVFTGERTDIPELLDLMDLFVFPSRLEGLPGALIEAMAAELPIVTTPVDGNSELITDGEDGLYIPTRNPSALAEKACLLLADISLAQTLGKNALKRAERKFSIEQCAAEYENVYRSLVR